jgi:transposase
MTRHKLSDEEWACIADGFDPPAKTGRPQRSARLMLDGILWIKQTGAPWRDLPQEFGPFQTVWHWFNKWNGDGTLDRILLRLQQVFLGAGVIDSELWCIDGTSVRAARCCNGGGKKGIHANRRITR